MFLPVGIIIIMHDIKQYEAMAMLELKPNERERLSARLEKLEKSFSALCNIETDGVLPLVSVLELRNVLREDEAIKIMPRDQILENAPEQYDGYFQVPGTLE